MNQSERLVRNLCEDARRRIAASKTEAMDRDEFTVSLDKLPVPVRRAVMEINMLTPRLKAARAVIASAGYAEPSCGEVTRELSIKYSTRKRETDAIARDHDARLREVATFQNSANVAILGKNGKEAKPVLDQLQRDLARLLSTNWTHSPKPRTR